MKKRISDVICKHLENLVDSFSILVFLLLFLIGLYALSDYHFVHVSAQMDEEIAELAPDDDKKIDIKKLQEINPEIKAWITIDNTKIDYPILHASDNTKYLTRNYRNEYATAGSIFLDYRNQDLNDDFLLIYGHRMDHENMFGGIPLFEKKEYFDAHRTGTLYTPDATYRLEISDYATLDVKRSTIYNDHRTNRNGMNQQVITEVQASAHQKRDVKYENEDRIIILSTCDKNSKSYRDVLLIKIGEEL